MDTGPVIIIGAGPAGLTAAYDLAQRGLAPLVLDRNPRVGGMARTERHKGFRFDIGGHRFLTASPVVQRLWDEVLPDDFLLVQRRSRICFQGRFFRYPLEPSDVLRNVGLGEGARMLGSYLRARVAPERDAKSFEQWVVSRFGRRLYERFFRGYSEKVWGVPCSQLGSGLASERIQGLSLGSALWNSLTGRKHLQTLTDRFHYPREGPGAMWEAFRRRIESLGGTLMLHAEVVRVRREGHKVRSVSVAAAGRTEEVPARHLITSMPLRDLLARLHPPPPPEVARAAGLLPYRDFLLVGLLAEGDGLLRDQWIYVHDPGVGVGRIQNFRNWSRGMVPDPEMTGLGMEYFCWRGDALWRSKDRDLIQGAALELERLGLAPRGIVTDGAVYRQTEAYPIQLLETPEHLSTVLGWLSGISNLRTVGRNGLHRYDNQDRAMLTGLEAAREVERDP